MSGLAPIETVGLAQFVQRIVLAAIEGASDPAERKERIMLARQCGFLSDEEVEDWIVLGGLVEA